MSSFIVAIKSSFQAIHGFGSIHIEGAELKNMGQDKHIGKLSVHIGLTKLSIFI